MVSRKDCANAIRALTMDAVQKANSGHPGAPMGMADIADVLWRDFLVHNPGNPEWFNRDRFILSNGHGSMLIYSLLYLTGYDLSIEDIKNFRQLHSKTPGHPEYGYTPGVETTTGPLGQGLANAVGMAIAEKTLAAQFNRNDHKIVDHFTYVFAGDGCLMEGISHEVCSLAGTLGLGKLIVMYDDNGISIDGEVDQWFSDDTAKRFESYGWQTLEVDGHDGEAIAHSLIEARSEANKPSIISCKTTIGFGAPNKQGKASSHGSPLGQEEIDGARERLDWPHDAFHVPEQIKTSWDSKEKGLIAESEWKAKLSIYEQEYPDLAMELVRRTKGELPSNFVQEANGFINHCQQAEENIASRKASQNSIEFFSRLLPELIGGSADLAGSNLTKWSGSNPITERADGNYIFYGVREFGMTAIASGIALHGGFIPHTATFLIFMEYARNATRMAALMRQRSILVYTHDSIGQGEDGPTHQPIEQLTSLRVTPNMSVWRPCDSVETAVSWRAALVRNDGPTALVFSRQGLQHQAREPGQIEGISRGAYILEDCVAPLEVIIIATGSEISICREATKHLNSEGVATRLVSMPSADVFDAQDEAYRETVLPSTVNCRVAVEAGSSHYWMKYVGLEGKVIGMERFGESAPGAVLMEHFGFTVDNVIAVAKSFRG
ncbi:MAG: transketolase [Gammaproteobacteria bacterium]|nr:transketolase [Gammaproteobacteria bacterium]